MFCWLLFLWLVVSVMAQTTSVMPSPTISTVTSIEISTITSALGSPTLTETRCVTSTELSGSATIQCSVTIVPSYTTETQSFTKLFTSTLGTEIRSTSSPSTQAQTTAVTSTQIPASTVQSSNPASTTPSPPASHTKVSTGLLATLVALAVVILVFLGFVTAFFVKRHKDRSRRIKELESALDQHQKEHLNHPAQPSTQTSSEPSPNASCDPLISPKPAAQSSSDTINISTPSVVSANIRNAHQDFDAFSFVSSIMPGEHDRRPSGPPKNDLMKGKAAMRSSMYPVSSEPLVSPYHPRNTWTHAPLRPVSEVEAPRNPKSMWIPGMPLDRMH